MKRSTRRAVVVILVLFATVSAVRAAISSGATRQAANSHAIAITAAIEPGVGPVLHWHRTHPTAV